MDRMKMRNPRKLFERLCDCEQCEENWRQKGVVLEEWESAGYKESEQTPLPPLTGGLRKQMITTYAPKRSETVYCEACYEREVVW